MIVLGLRIYKNMEEYTLMGVYGSYLGLTIDKKGECTEITRMHMYPRWMPYFGIHGN